MVHDLGTHPAAIVSFTLRDCDAAEVKARCAAAGINLSTSQPSSTLLDATARGLPPLVRASPHCYNAEAEIDRTLEVIAAIRR